MNLFSPDNLKNYRILSEYGHHSLAAVSVSALVATFLTAASGMGFSLKVLIFTSVILFYLIFYGLVQLIQKKRLADLRETGAAAAGTAGTIFDAETDERLLVLEEAGKFFGASLKTRDMFRLIAGRVREIIPHTTCAFFVVEDSAGFHVPFATGTGEQLFEGLRTGLDEGAAGQAYAARRVVRAAVTGSGRRALDEAIYAELNEALAVPLYRDEEVFCVMVLFGDGRDSFGAGAERLAEAVGERVAPLITGSYSFEKNLSNALTDSLTSLPNERAFYLVLENQVAEAQRFQDQRPLTVLAADICDFEELNERYGHSTGDRVLAFSADLIKKHLRRMDLLCRTASDEFLIILPTAGADVAGGIIERLEEAFRKTPFAVSGTERCTVGLNFGSASFSIDGETAQQLLGAARQNKSRSKGARDGTVIHFPKQYVN